MASTEPDLKEHEMSNKVSQVLAALRANKDVDLVSSKRNVSWHDRHMGWAETYDICVVPVTGLYAPFELQRFMLGLVPEVPCTQKDDFRYRGDTLEFGMLYFDEVIGTEVLRRSVTIIDPLFMVPQGDGEKKLDIEETIELQRRTWLRVFPCYEVANLAAYRGGSHRQGIQKDELSRIQRKFRRRLFRLAS